MPVLGDSPEDADELGEVLTLSMPDDVGSAGPKNGAIRESFRIKLRTSIGGDFVKAFPDGDRSVGEFRFAPAISSLHGKEG